MLFPPPLNACTEELREIEDQDSAKRSLAIKPPISFRPSDRTAQKRRLAVLTLARTGMLPRVGRPKIDQTKEPDFGQNGQKHLGDMPFLQ